MLYDFFIAHDLHRKAEANREELYANAAAKLCERVYCELKNLLVLCVCHVAYDYVE